MLPALWQQGVGKRSLCSEEPFMFRRTVLEEPFMFRKKSSNSEEPFKFRRNIHVEELLIIKIEKIGLDTFFGILETLFLWNT